jgi:hypothetical protein
LLLRLWAARAASPGHACHRAKVGPVEVVSLTVVRAPCPTVVRKSHSDRRSRNRPISVNGSAPMRFTARQASRRGSRESPSRIAGEHVIAGGRRATAHRHRYRPGPTCRISTLITRRGYLVLASTAAATVGTAAVSAAVLASSAAAAATTVGSSTPLADKASCSFFVNSAIVAT